MLFKVIGRSGEPMKAIEIFENEMRVFIYNEISYLTNDKFEFEKKKINL